MTDDSAARRQLKAEIAHWRDAVAALADLDVVASPAAWASLEQYLSASIRARLLSVVQALTVDALAIEAAVAGSASTDELRRRVLDLRARYVQVETILDFYGDAVNTRTNPHLGAILRGLDVIAGDSLDAGLRPLGLEAPGALVYLDKGLGASILRAGVRLWNKSHPSPVAMIKLTRHNLGHPTALLHETGHQFCSLTNWTDELAGALRSELAPQSRELAELWAAWASEIAGDVYAFMLAGWAPLPALANVVDGTTRAVYRLMPGDPHPFPIVRVAFNASMLSSWFGPGPWTALTEAWLDRHPPDRAPREAAEFARASLSAMAGIVDVCTRRSFDAFRGQPLYRVVNPMRVAPAALDELAERAGPSLLTSSYLSRRESLRIFAWLASRGDREPANAAAHRQRLLDWLTRLDAVPMARSA